MERFGDIYILECRINGKLYIGQTIKSLSARISGHKSRSRDSGSGWAIVCAIRKYGFENFNVIHFATCFDRVGLDATESRLIKEYDTLSPNGYNLTDGGNASCNCHPETRKKIGDKNRGKVRTAEQKARVSQSKLGKKIKPCSEDRRLKISEALRGKPKSQEHRDATRKANIGRKHTEEHKAKTSLALKGRPFSPEHRASQLKSIEKLRKKVIDQYGQIYESAAKAARVIGTGSSNVSAVVNGRAKSIKGFIFKAYLP